MQRDALHPVSVSLSPSQSFPPPFPGLPVEEAKENPNLILAITKTGGHIGFADRFLPFGKCLMDRILVQFANTVFEHDTL